jgi:hypothetical protein
MTDKRMYKPNIADIVAAVAIVALSITPLFSFSRPSSSGVSAFIYEDGKLVKQADLSVDAVYKVKNMEIQVENRKIRVLKSDCHHQICAHTGWISSSAQTIVCVPNKVLVEVRDNGSNQGLNAVSY